jgi:hypothetical protein
MDQYLLDILDIEGERAGYMNDSFKWRLCDNSILECTGLSNVFNDGKF